MTHLLFHKTPNSVSSEPGAAQVTDFFEQRKIALPPNSSTVRSASESWIQVLFDPGLVYGTTPAGTTMDVSGMRLFPRDQSAHPLAITIDRRQLDRLEPSLDLLALELSGLPNRRSEFLPVCIGRGPYVEPGDRVLALGFSVNESERAEYRSIVTYKEELVASIANVIEVNSDWDRESGIGPTLVTDGYWPGGMSGGPVFNEDGIVVGVVSRGGPDWSKALWLQKLPFNEEIYPGLDGNNPGWVKGWGVRNAHSLLELFRTKAEAEQYAARHGPADLTVQFVSTPFGCQRWSDAAGNFMDSNGKNIV